MTIALLVIVCAAAAVGAWIYREKHMEERKIEHRMLDLAEKRYTLDAYQAASERMEVEERTGKKGPTYAPGDATPSTI